MKRFLIFMLVVGIIFPALAASAQDIPDDIVGAIPLVVLELLSSSLTVLGLLGVVAFAMIEPLKPLLGILIEDDELRGFTLRASAVGVAFIFAYGVPINVFAIHWIHPLLGQLLTAFVAGAFAKVIANLNNRLRQ